ncbi:MAG: hypothetical protein K9N52_10335 [Verrucomicrobia bacterium]|nr:hypothetical protein [Verrucomicrobiota bacterium]
MRTMHLKIISLALVAGLLGMCQSQAGWAVRYVYDGLTGTAITNLTEGTNEFGEVMFPDGYTTSEILPELYNVRDFSTIVNSAEPNDYGSFIPAYIQAPQTGEYTFWVRSDDSSQLWLSTDANPDNKQLIASVPDNEWSPEWDSFTEQKSAPITLQKGDVYYVEILHKEGAGGDFVEVGWQLPDGTLQRPMPIDYVQPSISPLWDDFMGVYTDPSIVDGPYAEPSSSVEEGDLVTLYADFYASQPATYQWYKNGAPISGATLCSYTFQAGLEHDGNSYTVKVTNANGQSVESTWDVFLTVFADTVPPRIDSASCTVNPYEVTLVFNERLNEAEATNPNNYTLDPAVANFTEARLLQDDRTVVLTADQMLQPDNVYTVNVSGVHDLASSPNEVSNDPPTKFSITDGMIQYFYYWNLSGTSTNDILDSVRYQNEDYDEAHFATSMMMPWEVADNYIGQIKGYVTPPESGDYTFGMYGDDGCLLYLSTDEDPANKQLIAGYDGYAGEGEYDSANTANDGTGKQVSDPIALEAGQRYYIEALVKEGGGGDGIGVAWTGPGVQGSFDDGTIPGQYLSVLKTFGEVTIEKDLPAEVNATELRPATIGFENDPFDGKVPYSVHWYSNDVPTGVSGNSYTIDRVLPSYDGDQYYAVVTNYFSAATSQVVTLNVDYDTEPPQVDSAGSLVKNNVAVVFDEPIGFAQNSNFTLYDSETNEVTINSVSLGGEINGRSIVNLSTPLLETGEEYTVVTRDIKDAALDPNTMTEPSTNSFTPFNFDGYQRINNSQNWTAIAEGNQITMTAGGADIWNNADEFVYVYKEMTGDFDVAMRCIELENANDWSKLGLMMRQSTDAGSIHRFNCVTPPEGANNFYCTQARDTAGGGSTSNDSDRPAATFPNSWMRLQKAGDMVYFYKSEDGENWELYGWQSREAAAFTEPFLVGIAFTSHNTGATSSAIVDNLQEIPMLPAEIVTPPQSQTVSAGLRATFTVEAIGSTPMSYQWKVDGADIPGATNATYTTPGLLYPGDDASQYSVVVESAYGDPVESDVAVLTVTEDAASPTIYSVAGNEQYNQVTVTFDEWVDETTAINMANYSFDKGLTINSATIVNNTNVVLETSPQTAGEVYTVTVNGVEDINSNAIEPDSTAQFTAYILSGGFMKLERFYSDANNSIGGGIDSLTGSAKYTADNPDEVLTTSYFGAPRDITDNFGQRVTGYLVPPVSGDYTFHIASDDDSRLFISDDDSPANLGESICGVTGWTGYADWDGAEGGGNQASDPITLTGGEQYYVMAINSDGGGGDGVEVGWEYSGSDGIEIIGSEYIGLRINQDQSVITITDQPQDLTVTENRPAVFEIGATGTFEYGDPTPSYQWQRDGADIPGATSSTYEIPLASMDDNGVVFTCDVSVPGATVTSDAATLTVEEDAAVPEAVKVGALSDGSIGVLFNEKMDVASAENVDNYLVNGEAVESATLNPHGQMLVSLTTTQELADTVTVTINNVIDMAGNPVADTELDGTIVDMTTLVIGNTNTNGVMIDPIEPGAAYPFDMTDIRVEAGGSDIWTPDDAFRFVYTKVSGDVDMVVQVTSLDPAQEWAKAGLMVRESLYDGSRHISAAVTPEGLCRTGADGTDVYQTLWRPDTDSDSSSISNDDVQYPNGWIRFTREGDTFTSFRSTNGVDWTQYDQRDMVFTNDVFVGLAVTSHYNDTNNPPDTIWTTLAEFKNLSITEGAAGPAPELTVVTADGQVTVSWDAAAGEGYTLEATDSLETPDWQAVEATVETADGVSQVTIPADKAREFYRLVK